MRDDVTAKNLERSRTGFNDAAGTWYTPDNAGSIMPAVSDPVSTSLFRVSAVLDGDIDLELMQTALERVTGRFPYFHVELRKGLFWYYFVPCRGRPRLVPDNPSPCQDYDINRRGTCLFRVRVTGPRVACEFSHSLSDGTGCVRFLKNLVVEYLRLRSGAAAGRPGTDPASSAGPGPVSGPAGPAAGTVPAASAAVPTAAAADPDLCDLDGEIPPEEYEDAYSRYFTKEYPAPDHLTRAFHLGSAQLPRHQYRATYGILPLDAALALAKKKGLSLTELLAAAYLDAFQSVWMSAPEEKRRRQRPRLAVEIPVNMRKACPSRTLRNFSLYANVALPLSERPPSLDEAVRAAAEGMRAGHDPDELAKMMALNVSAERHPALRAAPLALKRLALRTAYALVGDASFTAALSNLGAVALPEPLSARVREFGFALGRGRKPGVNLAVVGYGGKVLATTTSDLIDRNVEREFFRTLSGLGLDVEIESNDGGAA